MFINTRTLAECTCWKGKKKTHLRKNQMPIKTKRNLYQIHWIIHDLDVFAAFFLILNWNFLFRKYSHLENYWWNTISNILSFRLNIIISIPFHCNAMLSHAFIWIVCILEMRISSCLVYSFKFKWCARYALLVFWSIA